jgi:hypothetical protein
LERSRKTKIEAADENKEDNAWTTTTTMLPTTKKVFEDKCAGFEPVPTNRSIYCFLSKV